jgi:hypothetical protein
MSDKESVKTQSSASVDSVLDLRLDPTLTPEEKAKLMFALEKHKEALMLLSQ